jgi:uncharacterized repeat protein (TIGR03803 family)
MLPRFRIHSQAREAPHARRTRSRRLWLEPLEDRCLLAASVAATLFSFGAPDGDKPQAGLIRDQSGNLYGTTSSGGAANDGTIFELAKGSGTITTLASFNGANGAAPSTALLMDPSGNLFGTTQLGGSANAGTVFELAQGSQTITMLASFNGTTDGSFPLGALITDQSGNLYGTTSGVGTSSDGTIFELARGSNTVTTLATFNGTNGANPYDGLVMDQNNNLYGTTANGGSSNDGTVFELAQGSNTITTLATFNGTNGQNPLGGLVLDQSGNLYGSTADRTQSSFGTIFELAKGSGTITTLATFDGSNGAFPSATLLRDSNGNLYGTAGTIFELAKGSNTITTLASTTNLFCSLITDSSGNLYGTSANGGVFGDGTVFELVKGSNTVTTLASFVNNGSNPGGSLVMDQSGNLYGITTAGGPENLGTIYELPKGGRSIITLATFDGTGAANPVGGLILDQSGNLYGVTQLGGSINNGTIFELAQGSNTITTLASFTGANGLVPNGALVMDQSGNLYGTADVGGADGDGVVYELAKGSNTITPLASFNGPNGIEPDGALILDSSGNLYGTASLGGASQDGTIFELVKGSGTITTLASFNGTNGQLPVAGLVMDQNGNLYGTTAEGGAHGVGTVFELLRGSDTIKLLASFDGKNGAFPVASLIVDSNGNLYGTTAEGGDQQQGTVFALAKNSHKIKVLTEFNGSDGSNPTGPLILSDSGHLYGTTSLGGVSDDGTVFRLAHKHRH